MFHTRLRVLQFILKQIIRKDFGSIVAEVWEKMRDNLKVVFISRQTSLKQHGMPRKGRLRNLQITECIMFDLFGFTGDDDRIPVCTKYLGSIFQGR
ncbi:hypothetical protein PHOSAC3_150204 [Mesotoga infera]|nr:hypothetical protein PHOSAC3_150204 [Mesotoga infera]